MPFQHLLREMFSNPCPSYCPAARKTDGRSLQEHNGHDPLQHRNFRQNREGPVLLIVVGNGDGVQEHDRRDSVRQARCPPQPKHTTRPVPIMSMACFQFTETGEGLGAKTRGARELSLPPWVAESICKRPQQSGYDIPRLLESNEHKKVQDGIERQRNDPDAPCCTGQCQRTRSDQLTTIHSKRTACFAREAHSQQKRLLWRYHTQSIPYHDQQHKAHDHMQNCIHQAHGAQVARHDLSTRR